MRIGWRVVGTGLIAASLWAAASDVLAGWQRIDVPMEPFIDATGVTRTPSCSGGPVKGDDGWAVGDRQFSFFVRPGDDSRLVIALDGGGACWNAATCVGSVLADNASYEAEVTEDVAYLDNASGIGDVGEPSNPFRDFTLVLVPYCTGDLHWGSRETVYQHTGARGQVTEWTIHHRGFDNLLAVTRWLEDHYSGAGKGPTKVVVAGASAGGYGAMLASSVIREGLGAGTDMSVVVDSANGVITPEVYRDAFGGSALSNGAWGVETTAPSFLQSLLALGYRILPLSIFTALSSEYPDIRFGQYTRAWDSIQIYFFNISKHSEDIRLWQRPGPLLESAGEWSARARTLMALTTLLPSYRRYLGSGVLHTILVTDEYYTERSAGGISFNQWVTDLVSPPVSGHGSWRNLSCAPGCLGLDQLTPSALLNAAGK